MTTAEVTIDASWIPAHWVGDCWFSPLVALCASQQEVLGIAAVERERHLAKLSGQQVAADAKAEAARALPVAGDEIAAKREEDREHLAQCVQKFKALRAVVESDLDSQKRAALEWMERQNMLRAADSEEDGEPYQPLVMDGEVFAKWLNWKWDLLAQSERNLGYAAERAARTDEQIEESIRYHRWLAQIDRHAPETVDYEAIPDSPLDLAGTALRRRTNGNRDIEDACWAAIRDELLKAGPLSSEDQKRHIEVSRVKDVYVVRRPLMRPMYEVCGGQDCKRHPAETLNEALAIAKSL